MNKDTLHGGSVSRNYLNNKKINKLTQGKGDNNKKVT